MKIDLEEGEIAAYIVLHTDEDYVSIVNEWLIKLIKTYKYIDINFIFYWSSFLLCL